VPRLFCSALYAPFDIALLKVIAHNGFAISAAGTHMSTPIIERHRDAMQRTRAALPAAHHLPGDFYTSPEIQRLERDRIFRREWLCVGRVEEFPNPGDYAALCIADEPVVLCRDRSGKLRAFFNVCRHRGTEVALGCGNSTRFTCPYHAWTYDLDGRLLGAPFTDDIENFDRALFGLKPVNLDSWGGFVFINLDPAARPLADALGSFREIFAPYRPEDCRIAFKIHVEYDSNWKAVAENFVDVYHLATLHANSFGTNQPLESYRFTSYPWGYTGRFRGLSPMTLDGQPRFGCMPWLSGDYLEYGYSAHLFPNMGFYARQDNIHWVTQWRITVDRAAADIHIMFPAEFHARPDFKEKLVDYEKCFELAIEEDRGMIGALQKGFKSQSFEPGPMSRFEHAVRHLINYNLDKISAP